MTPTSHQTLFQCRERWNAWMQRFHANRNGKVPPLEQPRISQREPRVTGHIVTPIGNHVWRVM